MTMSGRHEHSLRLPVQPAHLQLACNGVYIAAPHARPAIAGVWSLKDITCKPLQLEGHHHAILALCFGNRHGPTLLCSAATDYIIVWNIEKARGWLDAGQQIRGQVIGSGLGKVAHLAFCSSDKKVAACIGCHVLVLDSEREHTDITLEGHIGKVTCAEFSSHSTDILVSAGDDRTFKVWELNEGVLLYQSTIISSSPFISIAMHPLQQHFCIGTADGYVRIYDLTEGNQFRCLHTIDVAKLNGKLKYACCETRRSTPPENKGGLTISSRPLWRKQQQRHSSCSEDETAEEDESEAGCSILSLCYFYNQNDKQPTTTPNNLSFLQHDTSLVNDLLDTAPTLVIGCTSEIVQVNARTLEPSAYINLQEPIQSSSLMENSDKNLSLAGSITFGQDVKEDKLYCVMGSLFCQEVHILLLDYPQHEQSQQLRQSLVTLKLSPNCSGDSISSASPLTDTPLEGSSIEDISISVLSSAALVTNSPLKSELILKPKSVKLSGLSKNKSRVPGTVDKKGSIVDKQPIVFHAKVKSSGYTEKPRRVMFQPKINGTPTKVLERSKQVQSDSHRSSLNRDYPVNGDPPTIVGCKLDVADRPTAINAVKFSEDGQQLACGLVNTTAQVFNMPLKGRGCAFAGHKGSVTCVNWSHDGRWLLTSSDDHAACVWALGFPDPLMSINLVNNNFGVDREGGLKSTMENPIFTKSVKFGQFYYMDKFLLLTSGNSFYLYKYHLDTNKSDIKRYLSNNRYKLVKSFETEQAQNITAFSAVNSFHSYIALCASSNKSVEVFDLNVCKILRVVPDAHCKSIHAICQNQGSTYVSHPQSAYDLFVTAAAGDCIKLWDLRSDRCVRRYEGHQNRVYPCGLSISPCSRFLATGSEDRSAYIFDMRSGTYLHKLTGHTETVGDVAFHPSHPQLVTASLDGKIRLFKNH